MSEKDNLARFEDMVMPHMQAAYNLARWLVRNDHDAEDMVQESSLRAFRFFDSFRGVDARAWLLTIVRNTCYTWLRQNRTHKDMLSFDDALYHSDTEDGAGVARISGAAADNPESRLLQHADRRLLQQALEELPVEFREVIVLRELEGLSYKQITAITQVPLGTVMSRLARARKRLQGCLAAGETRT